MPVLKHISARSSHLHELLIGGHRRAAVSGDVLSLRSSSRKPPVDIPIASITELTTRRFLSRRHLVVRVAGGQTHVAGNLQPAEASRLEQDINDAAARLRPGAEALIDELAAKAVTLLDGSRYIRRSEADPFHTTLTRALEDYQGIVASKLPKGTLTNLSQLRTLAQPEAFERERLRCNRVFAENSISSVQQSVQADLGTKLTDEQALSVASDEDVTLVLAGAGTGKTAVIVGKVVHLVCNQGVDPSKILILAFNRKAAEEVRERLPDEFGSMQVSTFHAFGRQVIAATDVAPSISRLAADQFAYQQAIEGVIRTLLKDPKRSGTVLNYIVHRSAPYHSPFDFNTREEYIQYTRNVELRTLNGTLVKSFEELVIANHLTEHGVRFTYEHPYSVDTATKQHGQYRPDFYLNDYGIYIEHFALDPP